MKANNNKKKEQLGVNSGTASAKLKKAIMFHMAKKLNEHYCFQCGLEIESIEEFTVEHKIAWLDSKNPKELFFDLNNIAFSHATCNYKAKRPRIANHPNIGTYNKGCRCSECVEIKHLYNNKWMKASREKK